jgi:hypothetical protein
MTTLRVFRRRNVANARVFFATPPRARRRAGGGLRRSSSAAALGQDSTERRRAGTLDTLTSSGSGLKQSAFASAFCRSRLRGGGSLFFSRTSLHDLCDESPGAGRGPARPRTGFPQNPSVKLRLGWWPPTLCGRSAAACWQACVRLFRVHRYRAQKKSWRHERGKKVLQLSYSR